MFRREVQYEPVLQQEKRQTMKKTILALAAATMIIPTTAVLADPPGHAPAWGHKNKKQRAYDRGYRDAQYLRGDSRIWRGDDGRYYCKRDNGTTGLLIGAAVGGLAGNELAGRGDKTLGAILGAAGGALLGREIDRSNYRCR
jgi:hypothetical protein